jgi:ABC-type sulfate/molybdate transport systems ATPase subunit
MAVVAAPVLSITGVEKRYAGLRPLRIESLAVSPGERVALLGIDQGAAEVLVNLVTGAGVPDRGSVHVLGRATSDIQDGDEWLASLDAFGIVSERAVLLEGATLAQNLAMPFTLQIDPVPPAIAGQVRELAAACGLGGDDAALARLAGDVPPDVRARAHLARAVALAPTLLVLEHPTALVPEAGRMALADDVARVCDARGLSALVITQDQAFAQRVAHRTLRLQPGTGQLTPVRRGWFR